MNRSSAERAQDADLWSPGAAVGVSSGGGIRELFCDVEMFCVLIGVVAAPMYTWVTIVAIDLYGGWGRFIA